MNKIIIRLSSIFMFATAILQADTNTTFGKTFFNPRSQGTNWARWLSGQAHHLYMYDVDCINGTLSFTPEWSQTFNGNRIGQFLFFNGTNAMTFGPAGAPGTDVFARNFFLNDDFLSTVTAKPQAQNFIAELGFSLRFDEWVPGLFLNVRVPIVWTRWNMQLKETVATTGTAIAANKLGNTIATPSPLNSVIEAWKGHFTNPNFPAIASDMKFGKVDGAKSKVGVADVTFDLGYNFILNECSHAGIFASIVAPSGNRPKGEFVFEPIIGNGHHIALGGGVTGHYEFWSDGCDRSCGIYLEGAVYHYFRTKQHRLFDLKVNGIGSRYLWFKVFDGASSPTETGMVVPGANVTRRQCNVKNDVEGEAVVMLDYRSGGFTFDVGYNLWGRSRDKISITEDVPLNTFGVQGNTNFNDNTTQSKTTINGIFAPLPNDGVIPVTITSSDLNPVSAAHPGADSHKVFTHLSYTWENCDYLPFLGVGGEVEFSGINNNAFDQWGIWVKGGFTFS